MNSGEQKFPRPFGKYLLTELLAVGGMAEVYRAKIFGIDGFEKEMVVKKILAKYAHKKNFVQMFVDEAKIAVALTHGNIVPIYELGENGGSYYIAMEYVQGPTALDLLRASFEHKRALSPPFCLYIAAEIAKGLAYAHGKLDANGQPLGIVHRDLNLRNIVITPSGEVKLLDFGIARASTKQHQTASGVIKGTPGYMSPEQVMGLSVDFRSDLFSLGIILHELLTVRRLFRVRDVKGMRALIEQDNIAAPSTLRPELGTTYDALLAKLLDMRPERRHQSAGELEEDLRGLIAASGVSVTGRSLAAAIESILSPAAAAEAALPQVSTTQPAAQPVDARLRPATAASPVVHPAPVPVAAAVLSLDDGGAGPHSEIPFSAPPPAPAPSTDALSMAGVESAQPLVDAVAQDGAARFGASPGTLVLAKNEAIHWAERIGDDAELLAIARASGIEPKSLWRVLMPFALGLLALLVVLVAVGHRQIPLMWDRVVNQRAQRLGSVVIKTYPAGAEIEIDGSKGGLSPLRIDNLNADIEHIIVVRPVGEAELRRVIGPGDWDQGEDGAMVELRFGYDKLPKDKILQE